MAKKCGNAKAALNKHIGDFIKENVTIAVDEEEGLVQLLLNDVVFSSATLPTVEEPGGGGEEEEGV